MSEPRDRELARIYREAEGPEPPQRIDDAILAASRRAAGSRPRTAGIELVRRASAPVALAATILLTLTVTLMVFQDLPEPVQISMQPGRTGAPAEKAAQPGPGAPAKTISRPEARSDADALSKPQRIQESQGVARQARESEPRSARFSQAAPSAPAPSASSRFETTSTLQSPRVVGALAGRSAADEAKERSPEKWLEDIRKLKAQGKTPEAERELAEFKKRYPDYRLPEDLR